MGRAQNVPSFKKKSTAYNCSKSNKSFSEYKDSYKFLSHIMLKISLRSDLLAGKTSQGGTLLAHPSNITKFTYAYYHLGPFIVIRQGRLSRIRLFSLLGIPKSDLKYNIINLLHRDETS